MGAPLRIVSLVPSLTEALFELGLGPRVVGVTDWCVHPAAAVADLPKVGGTKNPSLARVQELRPDLVIANREENRERDVERLRAAGLRVWVTYPRTVAEGLAMIHDLGEVTGAREGARTLLDTLEPLYARARTRAAARRPVSVFYPIWRQPWMTIGADTYVHDLLATCGGVNVFGDRTRYPTVTLDEVAARRPEVILLPDEPFRFRRAHLADFEPYPAVPAVRGGRIHLVDGKPFSWHGPRLADALTKLPDWLAAD